SRFNSDPGMVGKMITLNDEDYSVVGVLPPDFQSPFLRADVWVPLSLDLRRGNRGNRFLKVIARLKPDVSREEAAAELNAVARRIEVAHPATNTGFGVRVVRLRDHMVRGSRQALLVLLLTVGFVLLISCSNVANLLLARAALQRRELAVRQALGAARSRIVRQLLTESMILALFGALFGLLLARLSVGALQSAIPSYISDYLPGLKELVIDRRVLGATVILSLLTGLVFGLSPSLLSSATDLTETLKEGAGSTRGRGHSRVRSFLVTSELTLAVVLLVGAALMIRSLGHLVQAGATLDSGNVLTLQFSLPSSRYGQPSERSAFVERVIDRVQSITGVQSVGAVSEVPPSDSFSYSMLSVEGRPPAAPGRQPGVKYHTATPGSFQALGIPLVKGRYFEKWDRSNSPPVAIVNQAMANRFWPGQDALGRRVKLSGPQSSAPWISVVGIVEDVKHSGSDFGEDPELYIPHSQNPDNTMALVVHASHGASNPLPVIESAVKAEDSLLPVYNVRTLKQTLADWSAPHRLITFLMAVFSFIAIVLASVGVYGVAAYSASQRTHEIGIRLALGARGSQIIKLIMKQGLLISGISLVLGLAGAYGLSKAISSLLVDVKPNDPATFMLAALILITLQVVAGYIPAARAAKADPVLALRRENT
ncbi:MAG TPA: ABC transporter permease, partial [Blastocatellia bacterium]|nr:ABC transporter permease [Blastocatellia bacterium]